MKSTIIKDVLGESFVLAKEQELDDYFEKTKAEFFTLKAIQEA